MYTVQKAFSFSYLLRQRFAWCISSIMRCADSVIVIIVYVNMLGAWCVQIFFGISNLRMGV